MGGETSPRFRNIFARRGIRGGGRGPCGVASGRFAPRAGAPRRFPRRRARPRTRDGGSAPVAAKRRRRAAGVSRRRRAPGRPAPAAFPRARRRAARARGRLSSWLYAIAAHTAVDHLRKNRRARGAVKAGARRVPRAPPVAAEVLCDDPRGACVGTKPPLSRTRRGRSAGRSTRRRRSCRVRARAGRPAASGR